MEYTNDQIGYIMTARKLLNNEIMRKPPNYLKVWMYLLLNATHKERGNLKRGQGFTSIPKLIDYCTYYSGARPNKPTKKEIYGIIEWLRKPHEGINGEDTEVPMIVTTKVTHGFVYNVVKYDVYQNSLNYESNNESNNENPTKVERRVEQGNNINKNVKNDKNKTLCDFFEEIWSVYPRKKGKQDVNKKSLNEINKIGKEDMLGAIKEYIKEIKKNNTEERYVKLGSTFFNGGYQDYLEIYIKNKSKVKAEPKKVEVKVYDSYDDMLKDTAK